MIHTEETELLTTEQMLGIVVDWTGGCAYHPGNTDVLEVLMDFGLTPERLAQMGKLLSEATWTRYAIAKLILDITAERRILAALARHGRVYHGLRLDEARRDVRELRIEAREAVQREVLRGVGNGHPE